MVFAAGAVVLAGALLEAASVSAVRWLADVKYLAGDDLKGRGNGTQELELAADYIAGQFQEAGLEPVQGDWFQPFHIVVGADLGTENLLVQMEPARKIYELGEDFTPFSFSGSGELTAPVVFAGYGITAPEYEYDDYQGIDAKGKIVIVLRHEPQEEDADSVFRGKDLTRHSYFQSKAVNARNHGAEALLVVNDPVNHSGRRDRLVPFESGGGASDTGIPMMQVRQELANAWFEESGQPLRQVQESIDADLSNHSFALPEALQLQVRTDVRRRSAEIRNVAGLLPGNDPELRDEILVIGAHYDHLGLGERDSMSPTGRGQIHNGADDNASGTAGVIELARILAAEGGNRRSVLFMAYSGEEMGLLGSAHYVSDPLLPLQNTVAMLNLDMIGRVNNNKLFVGGVGTSPGFRDLVARENERYGFSLDYSDQGYDASDHMSFARKQIPVMFFFTGLHRDYHKPSDDWQKVEVAGTARLLELVASVARGIDSQDARPVYTEVVRQSRGATGGDGQSPYRVYFGSVPDFGQSVEGVLFADIREGSPAAKAGLKEGDILIRFDGNQILNLYDFTYALAAKKPGDEVPVTVLRDGSELETTVTLVQRD